jgi:hypothetical protein
MSGRRPVRDDELDVAACQSALGHLGLFIGEATSGDSAPDGRDEWISYPVPDGALLIAVSGLAADFARVLCERAGLDLSAEWEVFAASRPASWIELDYDEDP